MSGQVAAPTAARMSLVSRGVFRTLRLALNGVLRVWFRLAVEGRDNVPVTGPFVLALGGHRSILDTPLASATTSRVLRYMGAESYFAIPVLGGFLTAMGGFPVERSATDRAALRAAESILAGGEPLVIFPEGTRQSGPVINEMRQGAAFLACRAKVPIVPVGIGGAERAMPKGRRWARPRRIALVIGPAIEPPVSEGTSRVRRSTVQQVNDELQTSLQTLFDRAQARVGIATER